MGLSPKGIPQKRLHESVVYGRTVWTGASAIEDIAIGLVPIPSSTTCFLIEGLQRLRDIEVDCEANVWFINAHAEGLGACKNANVIIFEVILHLNHKIIAQSIR